jgi:hypothetical protein
MRRNHPEPDLAFSALGPLQGSQAARCFVQETQGVRHVMLESKDGLNTPIGHPCSGFHAGCGTDVLQQSCPGVSAAPHVGPHGGLCVDQTSGVSVTPEGVALSSVSQANGVNMQVTPSVRPMQAFTPHCTQSVAQLQGLTPRPRRPKGSGFVWQPLYPQCSTQGPCPTSMDNTDVCPASCLGQHGLAEFSHDSPGGLVAAAHAAESTLFDQQPAFAPPPSQHPTRPPIISATAETAASNADEPGATESFQAQAAVLHGELVHGAVHNAESAPRPRACAEAHRASSCPAPPPASAGTAQTAPSHATNAANSMGETTDFERPRFTWASVIAEELDCRAASFSQHGAAACHPAAHHAPPGDLSGNRPVAPQHSQAPAPSLSPPLPSVQRQDGTSAPLPPIPTNNSRAPMSANVDLAQPGKKLRTPAEARAASNLDQSLLPHGFPTGPLPCDKKSLTRHVNLFTTNVHSGGGGYTVSRCRSRPNKSIGDRVGLSCNQRPRVAGAAGCAWNVSYEETTEGWVLMSYAPHMSAANRPTDSHHSHELETSAAVMRATAHGRSIPAELADLMSQLDEANFTTAEIDRALESRRRVLGLERTWNYRDIYSQNANTTSAKTLDASNLLQLLEERQREQGLACFARNNSSGVLSQVFVELAHAFEDWAVGGTENVLLFDPTWGTNRSGFKLCCFTTVSPTGQTVILAFALLLEETHMMFSWAFQCFAEVFRTPPRTFFTDGDYCIASAFAAVSEAGGPWSGAKHLLCVFHISKNFYQHIKCLFGVNLDAWKKAHDMFWSIAKESDAYSRATFDLDWENLMDLVDASVADSPAKEREMEWLRSLGARATQWAHCVSFGR